MARRSSIKHSGPARDEVLALPATLVSNGHLLPLVDPAVVAGLVTHDVMVSVASDFRTLTSFSGLGGILYPAVALASRGIPTKAVTLLDQTSYSAVRQQYHGTKLDILNVAQPYMARIPHCYLFWSPETSTPVEHTVTNGKAIPGSQVLNCLRQSRATAVYLNLTVGHDFRLGDLRRIAGAGYRIYLDPHMLLYSRDATGARSLRPPIQWRQWLSVADIIQLNGLEFRALIAELGLSRLALDLALGQFAQELSLGRREGCGIIVTGARYVCSCFSRSGRVSIRKYRVKTAVPGGPFHTIGCGDVFGAGVFSELTRDWSEDGLNRGVKQGMIWAAETLVNIGVCRPLSVPEGLIGLQS